MSVEFVSIPGTSGAFDSPLISQRNFEEEASSGQVTPDDGSSARARGVAALAHPNFGLVIDAL